MDLNKIKIQCKCTYVNEIILWAKYCPLIGRLRVDKTPSSLLWMWLITGCAYLLENISFNEKLNKFRSFQKFKIVRICYSKYCWFDGLEDTSPRLLEYRYLCQYLCKTHSYAVCTAKHCVYRIFRKFYVPFGLEDNWLRGWFHTKS